MSQPELAAALFVVGSVLLVVAVIVYLRAAEKTRTRRDQKAPDRWEPCAGLPSTPRAAERGGGKGVRLGALVDYAPCDEGSSGSDESEARAGGPAASQGDRDSLAAAGLDGDMIDEDVASRVSTFADRRMSRASMGTPKVTMSTPVAVPREVGSSSGAVPPVADPVSALLSEEWRCRDDVDRERGQKVQSWHRNVARMRAWTDRSQRNAGSLGLKLAGADGDGAVTVKAIEPGGAASAAAVTRADGGELPAAEGKLLPGDMILKISTAYTRERYQLGERSAIWGDAWPVMGRTHVMKAVGPIAGVFEGSSATIWFVRDRSFIGRWREALAGYREAVQRRSGSAFDGAYFQSPDDFAASPFAPGFEWAAERFPKPDQSVLMRADVTMAPRSEKSQQVLRKRLLDLKRVSGLDLDERTLYDIQNVPVRARVILRKVFDAYDKSGDGFLQFDELKAVHAALHTDVGLPPLGDDELRAHYEEADVNGDGKVSFDEYYYYLREQVLETMCRVEREGGSPLGSPSAGAADQGFGAMSLQMQTGSVASLRPIKPEERDPDKVGTMSESSPPPE